jgi:hypothetical protein
MSDIGECRVKITEAVLKVCKIEVYPAVLATHTDVLKHMPAKYPHQRTEMKTFTVMPGQYSFDADDIFQGEVPNKVVLGLVTSKSFNGDLAKNPFNFIHGYVSEVGVLVDDTPVPQKPYCPTFSDSHINSAALFRALFEDHPDLNISNDEFNHGYTLFNFTLRQGSAETLQTLQKGNCSIVMKFAKPIQETTTLVIMAKFPHLMEIDTDRQVTA